MFFSFIILIALIPPSSSLCTPNKCGFHLKSTTNPILTRRDWPLHAVNQVEESFSPILQETLQGKYPNSTGTETTTTLNYDVTEKSSNETDKVETMEIDAPDMKRILAFAIPAIGVWLCSPLLSMIDTSTVGLFTGTTQQAALNPAVAVTDYSARTMSFLYIGTTNMIATSQTKDFGSKDKPATAKTFSGALQLAAMVGVGLGSLLIVFARPMLRSLIGNDTIDPDVFAAALKYVYIRALSMPAAAVIGTAQAACLGMKDVHSPLMVIAVAAVVNLLLDILLVPQPHVWLGGAAGAAWATTASQYFAVTLFFRWLCNKSQSPAKSSTTTTTNSALTSKPISGLCSRSVSLIKSRQLSSSFKSDDNSFSTRGFLAGRLHWNHFFRNPFKNDIMDGFMPYVVPVTTTQVGRCSAYIAMGHTVSSVFGTVSMAANQIITSIFYALIPIADSLSLTAQTFLPGMISLPPSRKKAATIRRTITNLLKVSGLYGLVLAGIVSCIPWASSLFTTDPTVIASVNQVVPILFTIFSLHGVFCGSEGILLAQRDLTFLGRMYAIYFAVVPFLMLQIKRGAIRGAKVNLTSVWNLFLGYQLFRISAWVSRVIWLQRRTEKECDTIEG